MSDQPVYMMVNLIVDDADEYRKYEKGFFPLFKKYGGEMITFDDAPIHLEGEAPRSGRVILGKFPNEETAMNWYNDADYQALSEFRRAGTRLQFLTLVHSIPPRG